LFIPSGVVNYPIGVDLVGFSSFVQSMMNLISKFITSQHDSYLVDPASSHMLVSKIKPCMSKYKQLYGETADGSLNQL
jgi:hypothetical protein